MQLKEVKIPNTYKYVSAFLTMRCNLSCSYCLNTFVDNFKRKRQELSGKQWVDGLNRIESLEIPITFTGGEPFLHNDFIYILNNIKPELSIDILTNLYPKTNDQKLRLEEFIKGVNPARIKRNSPYPSIRVSYHPEQMGNGEKLIENVKKFKEAGFSIGIFYVAYPGIRESELFTQMQFRCLDAGIDYRRKDFTGEYKEGLYGNYSKYPNSVFQEKTKSCLCKTSDLIFATDGKIYKCHRDLYSEEFPIGNLTNLDLKIQDKYIKCHRYGKCHPCDVKVKTDYKQLLFVFLVLCLQ